MYKEGIKVGDKSYILSDEDGTLRILNGTGTSDEIEQYINLKNEYEIKGNEYSVLNNRLNKLREFDKKAKKENIKIFLLTLLIESFFIMLDLLFNTFHLDMLVILPTMTIASGFISKNIFYGTKKERFKEKEEIKNHLISKEKEIQLLAAQMLKLYKKIDCHEMVIDEKEAEIVPVTTVENEKVNVKMRVLKLESNRFEGR